ncbi:MAG: hypothetical protein M3R52_00895 [Acidobacteriota bacterium]|nr:hypothetical protein [Acidobacteriota bacterium]
MDRIIAIGRCQWRAFWRRFSRAGQVNAGNQGILLIFSVLILIRYLQSLHAAAIDLPQGKTRVFESLLMGIFLVWMFPLLSNARTSISTRKLLHLPLTHLELFAIRLITLLIPPYSWVILGGSLAVCYPIIRAQNPLAGVIAACFFIVFSALTGLTIAQLLSISALRKLFFVALVLSGLVIFYLVDNHGAGRMLSPSLSLPSSLVIRAAVGTKAWVALCELGVLTTVAFFAALWSFKMTLEVTAKRRSQKITIFDSFRIPGPAGGLAAKDFRYFRRLLDPYLGVLAAAIGCFYLVTADVASAGLFQVFLLSIFVPNAPLAFDSFGLDNRAGMDRLKLMPVTGKTILLSKNLAFLMIVGVQVMPLILLGCWRLGLTTGVLGIVEAAALAAMYLTWGNWMSVNHPLKMQFFHFSSSNGLVMEAIAGIMFGSLPGIIAIYSLRKGGVVAAWKIALVLLFSGLFYFISLSHIGNRFAQKQDRISSALS